MDAALLTSDGDRDKRELNGPRPRPEVAVNNAHGSYLQQRECMNERREERRQWAAVAAC